MSYVSYALNPVVPELHVTDPAGNTTVYPSSAVPSGYYTRSKSESVRRKRPTNLSDLGSLTPFGTHEEETIYYGIFDMVIPSGGYVIRYKDTLGQYWFPVGRELEYPSPDWQTKLRLSVKDQKVNLAQTLAEYKQAQNMFASNATTIAKSLRHLKRGEISQVFKTLGVKPKQLRGTISNRWLELQYGWMPLLMDLHGSVEELQSGLQRPRTRKLNVRVAEEARKETQGTLMDGSRAVRVSTAKTVVKVVAYLRQESLTATRLGFTNPLALAWELVPYSFVIDWLIPIGDWLNSLDAGVGINAVYGTVTTKQKLIVTCQRTGGYYYRRTYGRSVFENLPGPVFPSYSPSVGVKRVANALALLSQLKR